MTVKNKQRLFIILTVLFFGSMLYVSYDISSKTTFPGSRPQLQERLLKKDHQPDSIAPDTTTELD